MLTLAKFSMCQFYYIQIKDNEALHLSIENQLEIHIITLFQVLFSTLRSQVLSCGSASCDRH